jgi:hypothetical protein
MAAGQGFKTFTSGEVLTAADVNGYLMQGVGVFTNAANRDAEITSPQEGQFAYLSDTNVTTYYTGSAWANLDTTGMTNPMTTTGDTIYSSSGSTPARLGIGSTGNVLTVAGGVPTWAAPAATGSNYTLLNSGGTALTGAATITVSGLSGYDKFLVVIDNASTTTASAFVSIRLNTDTGANYNVFGSFYIGNSTYSSDIFNKLSSSGVTNFQLGRMGTDTTDQVAGSVIILGANSSGQKVVTVLGTGSAGNSFNGGQRGFSYSGRYNSASVISSISAVSDAGNFDAGTMFIYGSVA